jgi:hypothetical protein
MDGMRARGLVGTDGWLTDAGRSTKAKVEAMTDELAAPAYEALDPQQQQNLIEDLEPLAARLLDAGSQ